MGKGSGLEEGVVDPTPDETYLVTGKILMPFGHFINPPVLLDTIWIFYGKKLQFEFATTQQFIQKIGQIDQFKGTWKSINQQDNKYLNELRRTATIQSIGSSTRIEGETMSDAEIATLIKNLKINNLQTRDEQEVAC